MSRAFPSGEVPFLCLVGAGAASFWRGAWYVMDAALFPDDPQKSCASSLVLGFGGFAALHSGVHRFPFSSSCAPRAFALYAACLANVAAWRGIWMGWDFATGVGPGAEAPAQRPPTAEELNVRRKLLVSGLVSHASAAAVLLSMCHLTAALAPPARICVLSDRQSWAFARDSKYLEDVGMFIKTRWSGQLSKK